MIKLVKEDKRIKKWLEVFYVYFIFDCVYKISKKFGSCRFFLYLVWMIPGRQLFFVDQISFEIYDFFFSTILVVVEYYITVLVFFTKYVSLVEPLPLSRYHVFFDPNLNYSRDKEQHYQEKKENHICYVETVPTWRL